MTNTRAGPSTAKQPSVREKRPAVKRSVYTLSPRYITKSLSSALLNPPSDRKGKRRAEEDLADDSDDDGEGVTAAGREGEAGEDWGEDQPEDWYRDRTLRGWETRRAVDRASRWDLAKSPEHLLEVPNDDLLHALHEHTSHFYTAHNLLIPPKAGRRPIKHQWPSRKRQFVEAHVTPTPIIATDGEDSPRRINLRRRDGNPGWVVQSGDEARGNSSSDDDDGSVFQDEGSDQDKDEDEDEQDKHDEQGEEEDLDGHRSEEADDEDGENDQEADELDTDDDDPDEVPTKHRSHMGNYMRRDMYKALNGSALLALGILVEEHIIRHLDRSKFAARQPPEQVQSQHLTNAAEDAPRTPTPHARSPPLVNTTRTQRTIVSPDSI